MEYKYILSAQRPRRQPPPPTRSTTVKTDAQLRQLGGSDRFVNRQSTRQTHDHTGAKQVITWPVELKRRDEPTRAPHATACGAVQVSSIGAQVPRLNGIITQLRTQGESPRAILEVNGFVISLMTLPTFPDDG